MSITGERNPSSLNGTSNKASFKSSTDSWPQSAFKIDGKVDAKEMEAIAEMYKDKDILRKETQTSLREFINSDYRKENERILGGSVGIEKLQKFLNTTRPDGQKLEIDSRFGPETFFALIEYQNVHSFPATGIVSKLLKQSVEIHSDAVAAKKDTKTSGSPDAQVRPENYIDPRISREYSTKIGLRANGTTSDRYLRDLENSLAEQSKTQEAKDTKRLEKLQREVLSLESQVSSIQAFIENEVGVVAGIGDSLAKISKPFTGKKLYETGEDIIDVQIQKIQQNAISLHMRLTEEFTFSKSSSPKQEAVLSDIRERIEKVQKFSKQNKDWSDLVLTTTGGKDNQVFVYAHRLLAGIPEGAYKTVEFLAVAVGNALGKGVGMIEYSVKSEAHRNQIAADVKKFMESLSLESATALVAMLPKILDSFLALPPDRQVGGIAKFIGGFLVPVGVGKVLMGSGKTAVAEGKTLVKSGVEDIKDSLGFSNSTRGVSDDFVDTVPVQGSVGSKSATSQPAPSPVESPVAPPAPTPAPTSVPVSPAPVPPQTTSAAPGSTTTSAATAPTTTPPVSPSSVPTSAPAASIPERAEQFFTGSAKVVAGSAEMAAGSAAVGVGATVRAAELDVKGTPAASAAPKNPHHVEKVGTPKTSQTNIPNEEPKVAPKPVEVLSDTQQLIKDIRSLQSFFHPDRNPNAKNTGEVMKSIAELKVRYEKEVKRLKLFHKTEDVSLIPISPELRQIQKEVADIQRNKDELLTTPSRVRENVLETTRVELSAKSRELKRMYTPGNFPEGSSEFYRSQFIGEMSDSIEDSVREGYLSIDNALEHLNQLRISPKNYLKQVHGISLDAEIASRRFSFKRADNRGMYSSEQVRSGFSLNALSSEVSSLTSVLSTIGTRANNSGNKDKFAWCNQTINQINLVFSKYQSAPGLWKSELESRLLEYIQHIRTSPEFIAERNLMLKAAGKMLYRLEERAEITPRTSIEKRPLFDSFQSENISGIKTTTVVTSLGTFTGIREGEGMLRGTLMLRGTMTLKDGTKMTGKNGSIEGRFSKEGYFLSGELHLKSGAKLDYDFYSDPAFRLLNPSKNPPFAYSEQLFGDIIAFKDIYKLYKGKDMRTILEAYLYAPPLLMKKGLIQEDIIFLLAKMDTIDREVKSALSRNEPLDKLFARLKEQAK